MMFVSSSGADLQYDWVKKDVRLEDFESINLFRMNLRDMTVELHDDEENAEYTEGIPEDILSEIADEFYVRFTENLAGIKPMSKAQVPDPDHRSLVVELTLSGKFSGEEDRLLMKFIKDQVGADRPLAEAPLHFECLVRDSRGGDKLLEITDTVDISYHPTGTPFANEDDFTGLSEKIDFWARSFGTILEGDRK